MKSSPAPFAEPPGRSWRTIRQEVSAPAMSAKGLERQVGGWLKVGLLSVSLGLVVWGLIAVGTMAELRAQARREHSLEEIFLQLTEGTDG